MTRGSGPNIAHQFPSIKPADGRHVPAKILVIDDALRQSGEVVKLREGGRLSAWEESCLSPSVQPNSTPATGLSGTPMERWIA